MRIGDVVALNRRTVSIEPSADYVFLGMSAEGKGFFRKAPTPGSEIRSGSAFALEAGDFVYSRLFAWRGTFEIAGTTEEACVVSGEFPSFEVDQSRVDTRWLRYWLLSEPGLREVMDRSAGSTPGSRNRLREDRFLDIPLALPAVDTQRRVADWLDQLQTAESELTLRSKRAAELSEAFTVSASARPDLDDEAKARAGWRRVPLAEVLELSNREVQVESDESYDIAGVYSFGRGLFARRVLSGTQTSYKTLHRLQAGQLVMSRLKAWEGALAIVPNELEGWYVSPEFPTFDVDTEQVEIPYLGVVLTSERFWSRLRGASHGIGARRERVSAAKLLEQVVEVPSIEEQRSIAGTIKRVQASRVLRQRVDQQIGSLVPAALNQAFAGLS